MPLNYATVCRYASRLTHIKENHKFQKNGVAGSWPEDQSLGLQHTVLEAKHKFKLKWVLLFAMKFSFICIKNINK
jgi:hypothetical protein